MTGRTHRRFWKCFEALPVPVQKLARDKYALWKRDPYHTSLRFEERRNGFASFASATTTGLSVYGEGDVVAWFWIGTHEDYNRFRF